MQWLALFNWILLAAGALAAARVPLPSLGGQAACALGGLGAMVVFAAGGSLAFAWISCGLACIGALLAAAGAHTLVEDASQLMRAASQHRKNVSAGWEGFELPLFATAALLSAAVAVG